MNRIYRLVYNRTLGVWQVASELVKAARGGRSNDAGLSMAALHPVSFGLWLALGWVGLAQPVTAQQTPGAQAGRIIADPSAPERQRPTVVTSTNGTPLVNITTPSAAGVSRNTYSQFDVGSEGAILNNSRGNVQTQLGGWVQGNPWLGKGTARVILNEVNSANPSQLHGYVEVAGDRAQVVIANPAGISVDGGGFLNASRVTLTTGTAIVTGGVLDGYRVDGGAVRISGAGLDASEADYTDIISRSLEVNANIWAKQLQASLGSNVVSADHSQVSAQAASGSAPMFALDVGALGGMYANKIWLVGNEHGVGMRNAGKIGAQAGELVVQADGRLENLGTMQSQLDTRLSVTGGLSNSGTVSAGNEVNLTTQADLDNSGGTLNARRIEVEAASLRNAGGAIEQTGIQAFVLQAGSVINRNDGRIGLQSSSSEPSEGGGIQPGGGTGTGGTGGGSTGENGGGTGTGGTGGTPLPTREAGALRIAGALDNSGGRINAGGQMRLSAESGLDNAGGQLGLQRLALNGGDLDNSDGHIVVSDQASIRAGSVSNDRGRLEIANQFDFQAERLSNRDGKLTHTGAASTLLSVAGELDNKGGALLSKADSFTIDAAQLVNRDGRIEHAGSQALKITVDQLQGQKGVIATAAALDLRGGTVDNRDAAISAEHALLQLDSLDNRGGSIVANGIGSSIIEVAGSLDNSDEGLLASDGDLSVSAKTLGNEQGRIQHAGKGVLTIAAETLNGKGGNILGNGTLTLTGEHTDLSEGTTAAKKVSIDTGNLSTAGGKLIASGDNALDIAARQALNNVGGVLATNGVLSLSAAQLNNQNGTIQAAGAGKSNLQITGALDNSGGSVVAAGNTTINAARLLNNGGTVQAAGTSTLQITADGLLDNSEEGLLASGGDLSINAETLDNQSGRIEHAGDGALTIAAETLNGKGGSIVGNGVLTLTGENTDLSEGSTTARKISIDTGNLSIAGGTLVASGSEVLDITARQALNNAGGMLASNGALSLTAAQLNNRAGEIQAAGAGNSTLQVNGMLDNSGGTVAAAGNTAINAAELLNADGTLQAVGSSTLQVTVDGLLDNSEDGLLASGGDLTVSAQTLKNEKGRIEHAGDGALTIAAETLNGKGGSIVGNGALTLTGENTDLSEGTTAASKISIDTGSLSTAGGKLIASGDEVLDISVRQALNNAGGTVATNGALALSAAQLNNQNGTIQAAGTGSSTLHVGGALDNSGGTVAAAGNTTINAAELINVGGTVQAAGSSTLQLTVDGLLDNSDEGLLASGGDLTVSAKTLDNQAGRIEHAGDGALTVAADTLNGKGGSIIGNGTLTLTGEDTDLSEGTTAAKKINIDTGNLSTAGGKLTASGDEVLDIRVRQSMNNAAGTVATNGALSLGAAQLNNQNGTIQAAGTANSTLRVTGALDNSGGSVAAAGNTTINAAELINVDGTVQAAGSSTLQLTVDGLLDNSADGLLASGGDLTVSAQTLANETGRIEHAGEGALTIAAETLNGKGGSIIGNGTLTLTGENTDLSDGTTAAKKISIDTGNLSTAGGKLIASGDEVLDITVRQSMNNADGTVATNGALSLSAGQLHNQSGAIQAAGTGDSTLRVTGTLDNSGGALATAGATSINAGSLLNNGGSIAASSSQKLELEVHQKLSNDAGSIVGNGDIQLRAENLSNRGGAIETQRSIDAVVSNTLDNSSGTLLAGQALSLQGNTLLNQKLASATDGGILAGSNVVLRMDAVDNSHGRISATQGLDVVGTHLQNSGGVIDASGDLDITVAGLDNSGGKLIQRNEDGELTLQVDGLLANAGGLIGAEGDASLSAASVDNAGGAVSAVGDLTLTSAGAVNNQSGGLLQSGGATVLNAAGGLNNAGGRIDAAKAATITAADIDNSGGSILAGTKGDQDSALLVNAGSLLENSAGTVANRGGDVTISAGTINNSGGTLVAERDIALHASSVLNNAGTLYATRDLRYEGAQAQLDNGTGRFGAGGTAYLTLASANNAAGGRIQAGTLWLAVPGFVNNGEVGADVLHVNLTGAIAGTGSMFATQWLDARYDGDFTYTSQQLKSDGRLDLTVSGNFTNMGALHSAGELNVTAKDVTNLGSIVASNQAGTGVARIDASGTLDNRDGASIEADNLHLSANDVINTGDISGDTVLIEANTLVNGRDLGQAMAVRDYGEGFIGAVDHLELRVARQLSNLDGEIFSGGNLVIAGRADDTRVERLDNISGRIQAEQGLWLDATNVINQRRVLQTEHRQYVGQEQLDDPDAGSSFSNSVPYELRERLCEDNSRIRCTHFKGYTTHESKVLEGTRVVLASAASQLLSGGTMQLDVGRLDNLYSNIAAGGDLGINGRLLTDPNDQNQWAGVINNVALAGYKMIQQESIAEVEYQTCSVNFNCQFEPSHATISLGSSTLRKEYTLTEGAATITAGGGLTIIGGAINNTIVQASGGLGGVTTAPVSNIGNADLGSGTDHQAGGAAAVGSTASNAVNGGPGVQSTAGGQAQAGSNIQASLGNNVQSGAGVGAVDANGASGAGGVQAITRSNVATGNGVLAADDGSTQVRDGVDRMAGSGVQSRDGVQETVGAGATGGTGVQAAVDGHATAVRGPDSSQSTKVQAAGNAAGVSGGTAAAGAGPEGAAPQFVGTVERPLPGLVPADNGMFKRSADPDSPFLVSTAPRFVPNDTTGSEYLLGKLGSPDDLHKRLGDAYYEQRLVQDQLLALTGRQRLQGEDGLGQYRMLMDNAAQVADALGLNLGSALTGAQIGALDHDIVWLVEQEVDGQKVLVPVVYLSKATAERLRQGGALIEGDTLYAKASGPLNNDGTLAASKGMWLGADTLINSGNLSAGERLSIATTADTLNRGAISAGQVSIDAGRDFVQDASGSLAGTGIVVVEAGRNIALQSTNVVAGGSLGLAAGNDLQIERSNVSAMDNLSLAAGNDLGIAVSKVQAGGDLSAVAGRNIDVTAQTTQENVVSGTRKKTVATVETLQSSSLQAGGSLALQAGQDITLQAADLRAGETMGLAAGRDLNLTTVTTTDTSVTQESRKRYSKRSESLDETVHGTTLSAGGDIALVAGRDATLTAAQVASDEGGIGVSAGRDVKLLAEQEQHDLTIDEQRKKKGFLKSKTTTTHDEWSDSIAVTTTLSGETVTVAAGRDLTSQGAQIAGTGDVLLAAGRDVVLDVAQNTHTEVHDKTVTKSGLFSGGGVGFTIGKQRTDTTADIEEKTHTGSLIGSTDGRVDIAAGRDVTITGSDVLSTDGIGIIGQNVTIQAAEDSTSVTETQKFKQAGINVSLKGGAVDTALAVKNSVERASEAKDDRLSALHAAKAGQTLFSSGGAGMGSLKGMGDQIGQAKTDAATEGQTAGGLSLRIGIGASKSSSSTEYTATTSSSSRIASEGDVVIQATGDGQGNGGDLKIIGSKVEGDNVALAAANDLILKSQQETRQQIERNKSSSGEIGITIGSEAGFGVYVAASAAKGKGDGSGTTHAETTIDAANTLTMISGRDMTLEGAQAKGKAVIADVGRDLTLISQQDSNDYKRKDVSAGIDVAVGTGGASVSANYNQSKINSTYTSVKEQTGIQAGEGGFDINVGGHTQLTGAAIASTADPSRNHLSTGSLSVEDLKNEAAYKASSVGISVSGSTSGGMNAPAPSIGIPQSEKASSVTRGDIAAGTVEVRNGDTAALDGLSRDTTVLQQDGLKEIFDQQKVQELLEMGQVASEVGMRAAGDIAQKMGWEEGSKEKAILHGAVGAAIAALGGGSVLDGLTGAAASQAASLAAFKYLSNEKIDPDSAEGKVLLELVSVAIGAAVGGATGAATALAGEQFNRQLHWDQYMAELSACEQDPSRRGCAAILEMSQNTASYPITLAGDSSAEYGVVVNVSEATGKAVSYTLTDLNGIPRIIMQEDEYNNFVSTGRGGWLLAMQPGYALSLGSAAIHASKGKLGEAASDLRDVFTSSEYWGEMLFSSVVSIGGIGSTAQGPSMAGSIRRVNPKFPADGWRYNCVNCVIATDASLGGAPAMAMPQFSSKGVPLSVLESHFSATFKPVSSVDVIARDIAQAGSGARGVVYGVNPGDGVGHVFNVVNQGGVVRFLDGQTGGAARVGDYKIFKYMRTDD